MNRRRVARIASASSAVAKSPLTRPAQRCASTAIAGFETPYPLGRVGRQRIRVTPLSPIPATVGGPHGTRTVNPARRRSAAVIGCSTIVQFAAVKAVRRGQGSRPHRCEVSNPKEQDRAAVAAAVQPPGTQGQEMPKLRIHARWSFGTAACQHCSGSWTGSPRSDLRVPKPRISCPWSDPVYPAWGSRNAAFTVGGGWALRVPRLVRRGPWVGVSRGVRSGSGTRIIRNKPNRDDVAWNIRKHYRGVLDRPVVRPDVRSRKPKGPQFQPAYHSNLRSVATQEPPSTVSTTPGFGERRSSIGRYRRSPRSA